MQTMLAYGEYETVLHWISSLPEEVIDSRPLLQVNKAWILGILNQYQDMEFILQRLQQQAQQHPEGEAYKKIQATIAFLHAMTAFRDGDLDRALQLASLAREEAEARDPELLNNVVLLIGSLHLERRDVEKAARAFSEVEKQLPAVRSLYALLPVFSAITGLADVRVIQGNLRLAEGIYQQACGIAVQWGEAKFHILGRVYISLGELHYQRNELRTAMEFIQKGIEHYQKWGHATDMAYSYASLSRVLQAFGQVAAAKEAMAKALVDAQQTTASIRAAREVRRRQVQNLLVDGDLRSGEQWAKDYANRSEAPVTFNDEKDQILRARILMAQNEPGAALTLLTGMAEAMESSGRAGSLIETLVLQALAYHAAGQTENALKVLKKALKIAEPDGYIRVFVDEGEPLRCLLEKWKAQVLQEIPRESGFPGQPEPDPVLQGCRLYIDRLLDCFSSQAYHSRSTAEF
jgi:LuxR family maltose regulon positive regulatory protein